MTKYIIFIKLFWLDPIDAKGVHGLEISHLNNKPLYFLSQKACVEHVQESIYSLKWYARSLYGPIVTGKQGDVRRMWCIEVIADDMK